MEVATRQARVQNKIKDAWAYVRLLKGSYQFLSAGRDTSRRLKYLLFIYWADTYDFFELTQLRKLVGATADSEYVEMRDIAVRLNKLGILKMEMFGVIGKHYLTPYGKEIAKKIAQYLDPKPARAYKKKLKETI